MLDTAFWKNRFGMDNPESYTGQGTVCDGVVHINPPQNNPNDNQQIRIQAK